jgi:hypothetical protein
VAGRAAFSIRKGGIHDALAAMRGAGTRDIHQEDKKARRRVAASPDMAISPRVFVPSLFDLASSRRILRN